MSEGAPPATENAALRHAGLEGWGTAEAVDAMVEGQLAAVAALHAVRGQVAFAAEAVAARLEAGGRLVYLGAGTSGRLAAIDAAELPPTFGWPPERAVALIAGGPGAFLSAAEGAEDDGAAAREALDALGLSARDAVIGLAASGRTPFAVEGLRHARARGALTIGFSNDAGSPLAAAAEIGIEAPTGAEVLAGSTRMKAGTAQKAFLTCLSTAAFVRMGYVHSGRMVEMAPTNAKLRRRAAAMVAELAGAGAEEAEAALASGGSIKAAILILAAGCAPEEAARRLAAASGRLHTALKGG